MKIDARGVGRLKLGQMLAESPDEKIEVTGGGGER